MLVLTRKQNEKIRIGSSIVITVVKMKGKAVRLGIEAPSDVNILRGELVFEIADDDVQSEKVAEQPAGEKLNKEQTLDSRSAKSSPVRSHSDQTKHWPAEKRDERMSANPLAPVRLNLVHQSAGMSSSPSM